MTSPAPIVVQREHAGVSTPSPQVTQQTVQKMLEHIRSATSDPLVLQCAKNAAACSSKLPGDSSSIKLVSALWWWIKHHVKFLHHDQQICELLNECKGGEYQLLVSPSVLLRMSRPAGDCAVFTMLGCAFLECMGCDWRIVTIACDRETPDRYSHVCAEVFLPDKKIWCTFDASHGVAPGWEVPEYDQTRRTSWDKSGNVAADLKRAA